MEINVAPFGTATQSSLWNGSQYPASLGNDGNFGNFTHTSGLEPSIWEVDLGHILPIKSIDAYNRCDCCQDRLRYRDLDPLRVIPE